MVKVYGPMMSIDAAGTLADTVTFSKWKGRNYVRERVIPSNPKSGAQVGRRAMFKFLTQNWITLSDADKASWQDLADEIVSSPFNAYLKENMEYWHNFLPPSKNPSRAQGGAGGSRELTAAVWEENRIKLSTTATVPNNQWGIVYYADTSSSIDESVGCAIIAELDEDTDPRDTFWTPPSVTTWYFDSMAFSYDGNINGPSNEVSAVP